MVTRHSPKGKVPCLFLTLKIYDKRLAVWQALFFIRIKAAEGIGVGGCSEL